MNEVNETLRILNAQISEYKRKGKEALHAYDEFSLKCQESLKQEDFDYISGLLYRLVKYYEIKIEESETARKEIMDKYDIPYNKGERIK